MPVLWLLYTDHQPAAAAQKTRMHQTCDIKVDAVHAVAAAAAAANAAAAAAAAAVVHCNRAMFAWAQSASQVRPAAKPL
jgi:hypothetical protein